MSRPQVSLNELLTKMKHHDQDERYMATSDLCTLIQNQASSGLWDEIHEQRLCGAVLLLLDDPSHDVQSVAVKTLGELLKVLVHPAPAATIGTSLCDRVLDPSKDALRDVYSIGLRTLVTTVPASMGDVVSETLNSRFLAALEGYPLSMGPDMACCVLDVWVDVLGRFGMTRKSRQSDLLERLLPMCLDTSSKSRPEVRKRASAALGCLAAVLSEDQLLDRLVHALLSNIGGPAIQTMCIVSGKVGSRLSGYIGQIVPIFLKFCDPSDAEGDDDEDEESGDDNDMADNGPSGSDRNTLRESCFAGFESFVVHCPAETEPYLSEILKSAIAYMRYDPNYHDEPDDEDDDDVPMDMEDDEDYGEDDYDDYSDEEDDDAWKVRRSAVRVVVAVAKTEGQASKLWTDALHMEKTAAAALLERFRDRDEACRVDVIEGTTVLLQRTSPDVCLPTIPALVAACHSQLRSLFAKQHLRGGGSKNRASTEKTISATLALLVAVCALPGGHGGSEAVKGSLGHVVRCLGGGGVDQKTMDEGNKNTISSRQIRLDALGLARAMFSCGNHNPVDLRADLDTVLPVLCHAVAEDWYRLIGEALAVLAQIPSLLVVDNAVDDSVLAKYALQLHAAISPRLAAHDLDQEIKEQALGAASQLLSNLPLPNEVADSVLVELVEKLDNETTRAAALRTLSTVASSSRCKVDLGCIRSRLRGVLTALLKQQNRGLVQSALECLHVLLVSDSVDENDGTLEEAMRSVGGVVVETDIHLSHLGLLVSISVLEKIPSAAPHVVTYVLPKALSLSTSALVDMDSLLQFWQTVVQTKAMLFADVRSSLESATVEPKGYGTLARCLAVLAVASSTEECQALVEARLSVLEETRSNTDDDNEIKYDPTLDLLVLGEIGQRVDLGACADRVVYISRKHSSSVSAPCCLGWCAVGGPKAFEPVLLEPDRLSALKEYLVCCHRTRKTETSTSSVTCPVDILLERASSEKEEGVRSLVAECLGTLACLHPSTVLPALVAAVSSSSSSPSLQWTIAGAIRVAVAGRPYPKELEDTLPSFLALLESSSGKEEEPDEEQLKVRHAALKMVYSAVHHAPVLVAPFLPTDVQPHLFVILGLKLQRQIDMGCFKHKVDLALPLRKTALGIVATALENCPDRVDVPAFVPHLARLLTDTEEIQLQAHPVAIALCQRCPGRMLWQAEGTGGALLLVEPLQKFIHKVPKGNKTGIELERANELKKSGLRTVMALKAVVDYASLSSMSSLGLEKLKKFIEDTENNPNFRSLLEALSKEH